MNMKIYISGKITGLLPEEYKPKFEAAEKELISAGIQAENIVNPIRLNIPTYGSWGDAMQTCLDALKPCTAIYMLRCWEDSFGARHELTQAGIQRKDIYFEESNDIEMIRECIRTGVLS